MKYLTILLIFIFLGSCSGPTSRFTSPSHHYEHPNYGIRIIEKEENWEPESNCKMLKYVTIHGENIQDRGRGYQSALRSLSNETRRRRGTLAKVRDYTNNSLYAYIWFCSDDYS
jgi:hypothetical protein